MNHEFIPATCERKVKGRIVFRPIKSWHSATYAGEGLVCRPNCEDRSGCLINMSEGLARAPRTVTHRLYWDKKYPKMTISAFLSYPNAMSCSDTYFWEALLQDDAHKYDSEEEMETAVCKELNKINRKVKK